MLNRSILFILIFFICGVQNVKAATQSYVLSYPELMIMKPSERVQYLRQLSKILITLSPREQKPKTVFQLLWSDAYAAEAFQCIGGGVPVPAGGACGAQSYAGFSCRAGYEICNPFLFGVKASGEPFCYKDATSDRCFRNVIPGQNSVMDLVFEKEGSEQAYNLFMKDIDSMCHHIENKGTAPLVEVKESQATLRRACHIARRQTEINRQRQLSGYTGVAAPAPATQTAVETSQSVPPVPAPVSQQPLKPGHVDEDCSMVLSNKQVKCTSKTLTQRNWDGVRKMVCLYNTSGLNFCPSSSSQKSANTVDGYLKRIDAISEIMGVDRRQLACMALIESGLSKGAKSSSGAKGIGQFTPETAKKYSDQIQTKYNKEWTKYQTHLDGDNFPSLYVTSKNISEGHVSYGLFAMAAYLKDNMTVNDINLETQWSRYMADGGDPLNLFHAQVAAYNNGPLRMNEYTDHVLSGQTMKSFSGLKSETTGLMEKFNQCMYSDSGWAFAGSQPSAEKIESCGIHKNEGICSGDQMPKTQLEDVQLQDYVPTVE